MIHLLYWLLLAGMVAAQTPSAWTLSATTSRTALWVGDRFEYIVRVDYRPELEFVSDHLKKDELNLQPFEVLDSATETGTLPGGLKYFELRLQLTTYAVNSPEIAIPPITLFYINKSRTQNKEETPAEALHVPALPMAVRNTVVDASSGIRDRKPPLPLNRMAWLIPLLLGLAGLTVLSLGLMKLVIAQVHSGFLKGKHAERTRKRSLSDSMQEIRGIPANTPAELENFYNKASEIIRGLAAEKLGDGAGLTPSELKHELSVAGDSERHASGLSGLLAECELIRYAPDAIAQGRDKYPEFLRKFEQLTQTH